jgi:hypothetical protein
MVIRLRGPVCAMRYTAHCGALLLVLNYRRAANHRAAVPVDDRQQAVTLDTFVPFVRSNTDTIEGGDCNVEGVEWNLTEPPWYCEETLHEGQEKSNSLAKKLQSCRRLIEPSINARLPESLKDAGGIFVHLFRLKRKKVMGSRTK